MQIGSKQWERLIIDGARTFDIVIDTDVTQQLAIHASELIKWNRKFNLTAITHPKEIALKHFLDSLVPARFIPDNARMMDIGSGGGFPGIPLKILKPSLSVLLIDGTRKKVNFLKHVLRILKLEDIEAHQIRAENLGRDATCSKLFDIIISRALSAPDAFVRMALPLLTEAGTIIVLTGEANQAELQESCAHILNKRYFLEVENYKLPAVETTRSIVIIRRLG
jgi:16S rRNA (guanine527-N7)-methyltransferase